MVNYTCQVCLKTFNHKGHYDNHLKRRFPCFPKTEVSPDHIEMPRLEYRLKSGALKNFEARYSPPQNGRKTKKSSTKTITEEDKKKALLKLGLVPSYNYDNTITEKTDNFQNGSNTYFCNWCKTLYKHKHHLTRHMKTCKHKKLTLESIEKYEKRIDNLQEIIKDIKKDSSEPKIVNITNNTNNFLYVDNSITTINEIKLNPFGKESIAHITTEVLQKALQKPHLGLINLIKEVHFNDDVPENHNIQMINKREPYVQVFNGEKWEKQDKKVTIQNMIASKKDIMDDYYDDQVEKNLLNSFIKNNYEKFTSLLDDYINQQLTECTEQVKDRVKNRCQKLYREIYNHTELLLQHHKTDALVKTNDV